MNASNQSFAKNPDGHLIHGFLPSFCVSRPRPVRELLGILATAAIVAVGPALMVLVLVAARGAPIESAMPGLVRLLCAGLLLALLSRAAIIAFNQPATRGWLVPTLLMAAIPPLIFVSYQLIEKYLFPPAPQLVFGFPLPTPTGPAVIVVFGWLVWSTAFMLYFKRIGREES